MKIISTVKSMARYSLLAKSRDKTIGLVPTMGALHEGHLSLVRRSVEENDLTVVSVFVNPLQFGKNEDYSRYPGSFSADCKRCRKEGADAVYHLPVSAMYPENFSTTVYTGGLSEKLCGKSRPGHFKGVCTVVTKLFNAVLPDKAYFGQKDFQQVLIIKKMAKDLDFPVKVKACPTKREQGGLALSSRNAYLSEKEREAALLINRALKRAKYLAKNKREKSAIAIIREMKKIITAGSRLKIDYLDICDPETLCGMKTVKSGSLVAVAVYAGKTRLIDNAIL